MAALRIVGVLFVVLSGAFVYLVISGPSATRGVFVFLVIEFIVLGVIFTLVARAMTRGAQHAAQLLHDGLAADATVVRVTDTGVTINNNPRVKLQLRVVPSSGDPFDISATKLVSRVAIPRAGETYKIKYNLANPQDFVFTDAAMASVLATSISGATIVKSVSGARTATIATMLKSAAGSDMEKKLQAALSDPAVRERFAHLHNADEAKEALRGILGTQVDSANVTFQMKTDVIGSQPTQTAPLAGDAASGTDTAGVRDASSAVDASGSGSLSSTPSAPNLVEQLTKLEELRDKGAINAAEFDEIKLKLMSGT